MATGERMLWLRCLRVRLGLCSLGRREKPGLAHPSSSPALLNPAEAGLNAQWIMLRQRQRQRHAILTAFAVWDECVYEYRAKMR